MKYFKYSIYGQIIIFNWFPIKLLCLIYSVLFNNKNHYKSETVDFVFLNVFSKTLYQHWYIIILKQRIICYGGVGIIGPNTSNEAYCVRLRVNNITAFLSFHCWNPVYTVTDLFYFWWKGSLRKITWINEFVFFQVSYWLPLLFIKLLVF